MSDDKIIDAEATFVGDMHRALVALQFENRELRQRLESQQCADCQRLMADELCKADIWLTPLSDSETT